MARQRELEALAHAIFDHLEDTVAMLQAVLDILPDAVFVRRAPDGRLIMANREARRLFPGLPDNPAALGAETPEGRPLAAAEIPEWRALRGEMVRGEQMVLRLDGRQLTVLAHASPICDRQGQVVAALISYEDVTPLRELVRARDAFLTIVSHDLKNLLAGIKTPAQLLASGRLGPLNPEQQKMAGLIERATGHMGGLINAYLDVSRLEAGQFPLERRPLALAPVLEEACRTMQPQAEAKGVLLSCQVGLSPRATVEADPGRILQVVHNLLDNALKFTPAGGRVVVRAEEAEEGYVCSVADDGPGIPEEARARIFDRFFQAAGTRRSGAGLGLAIAKGIIDAHGGRIWCEASESGGAFFSFLLPRREPPV